MSDETAKEIISSSLSPGETLRWSDSPEAPHLDMPLLVGLILGFMGLVLVFPQVLTSIASELASGSIPAFIFTALILLALLWVIRTMIRPGFEAYGISDHHLFVVQNIFPKAVATIPLHRIDRARSTKSFGKPAIALLVTEGPLDERLEFKGGFGIKLPFFKIAGYMLHDIEDPQRIIDLINKKNPRAG